MDFKKKGEERYAFIEGCGLLRLLAEYRNGNYTVYLYEDGTKVRETEDDEFIPEFAECNDICITKKCGQGCNFCYEGCTKDGKHGRIDYKFLDTLHAGTEAALNGNDMDHPQLDELLHKLREQGVFTNITVSKTQFLANYDKIVKYQKEGLIFGVGVSANCFDDEFIGLMQKTKNTVIHTIAGICPIEEYKKLYGKNVKVLILGYKTRGRGINYKEKLGVSINLNISELNEVLPEMAENIDVVSFDNLAIEQLSNVRNITGETWDEFYMGDDGQFTFYIDLVNGEFSKNSCIDERFPIGDKTMNEMFNFIREKYGSN